MPSNKAVSGSCDIECRAFPPFSQNKVLLHGKTCHIIEPYDSGVLVSTFTLRTGEGFIVKVLDQNGAHLDPNELKDAKMRETLVAAINIQKLVGVRQTQLFFSVTSEPILVDMFDGSKFASPGMLMDIYGKRIKVQSAKSVEKYDQNKTYNAIIKPAIVCYDNNEPVYLKS